MSAPVVITLPWPDKRLSPNARGHWRKREKPRKAAKDVGYWCAMEAGVKPLLDAERLSCAVAFVPPDARARDTDNMLSNCKHMLDGIAQAIGVDDSKWTLTIERRPPAKPGSIVVTIFAKEPAE